MDETGLMSSKPGSVKVLVRHDDRRDYRGARVQRQIVIAVECISADGRCLEPMVIWPFSTHRSPHRDGTMHSLSLDTPTRR